MRLCALGAGDNFFPAPEWMGNNEMIMEITQAVSHRLASNFFYHKLIDALNLLNGYATEDETSVQIIKQ